MAKWTVVIKNSPIAVSRAVPTAYLLNVIYSALF